MVGFTHPDNRPIADLSFIEHTFDANDASGAIDFLTKTDESEADTTEIDTRKCAILAPTNKLVQYWNDLIQTRNPMPLRTYVGVTDLDGDQDARDSELADDKLDTYESVSAPSHILSLKEGDWVFLTRTIDKHMRLVANTRVRIVQLREHNIEIALPSDDGSAPKLYNVCRWRSLFRMHKVTLLFCPAPGTPLIADSHHCRRRIPTLLLRVRSSRFVLLTHLLSIKHKARPSIESLWTSRRRALRSTAVPSPTATCTSRSHGCGHGLTAES